MDAGEDGGDFALDGGVEEGDDGGVGFFGFLWRGKGDVEGSEWVS